MKIYIDYVDGNWWYEEVSHDGACDKECSVCEGPYVHEVPEGQVRMWDAVIQAYSTRLLDSERMNK
jgi:hypothetical protein